MRNKVVLADADAEFAAELAGVLEKRYHCQVLGIAADGEQTLQMVPIYKPDILVMDLLLPKYDGLTVIERLPDPRPEVVVVLMLDSGYVHHALKGLKVHYFINKLCKAKTIGNTVRKILLRFWIVA